MKSNVDELTIKKLLEQSKKDNIQKIVARAVIKQNGEFLLLERSASEFLGGLVILPGGAVDVGENLLHTLTREIKEETNLVITTIIDYLGFFDYASSSGKKTRQFNFLVKTKLGKIKVDPSEHSNYFLSNPSDKEFSKLNISKGTKTILATAERKIKIRKRLAEEKRKTR